MSRVLLLAAACVLIGSISPTARAQTVEMNLVPASAVAPVPINDNDPPEEIPPAAEGDAMAPTAAPAAVMPTPVGISSKPVVQTGRAPGNVDPASTMYAENRHSPGVVWMIVGGAGLITGLIIDQPVITIAGALVMLYGIYLAVR